MPLRLAFAVGFLALALLAALQPWLRFVLTLALATGLAVLGIMMLLRAGQVSFGHALYVAVGAYTIAFARPRLDDVLLLLAVAVLAAVVAGILVGLFVCRYRDIFFGMLNLAFSMVVYSLLEKLYWLTRGTDGIRIVRPRLFGVALEGARYEWALFALALVCVAIAAALVARYLRAPAGEALSALKTRETRLEFAGVSARRVLFQAYVVSAGLAGLGGGITALATLHVTPLLAYWTHSGELVFVAILGGTANVLGPFLGAVVFELVRVHAAAAFPDAWQMILGLVLLGIVLLAARGLVGLLEELGRWWGRRV
ncbi:MAG: branched-chain amino acid ABC transporter permease [Geminicoccaceae bacterium]|nr:branched-chain amino acid ABC transporter permease [Geminicoccaceae bacterium]MDW8124769.1 branched-chain amino acid ABC transporter permease [Geminicoccaceae bacterium]MDW8342347.1 branched-chain amino acid ABC transporter permease [Geminicoccaceae bacterium]